MVYLKRMKIITHARGQFIAKIMADVGKTIVGISFAGYFFERFSLLLRWVFSILGPALLVGSIFIEPREK